MGKSVNQTELSEILGKTDVTVWEWQKEGLPVLLRGERGQANRYDTEAVIGWIVDRALQRAGSAKERLTLESLELDVKEKRAKDALRERTLVPREEVEPVWRGRVLAATAYMLSRASQLAADLETAQGIEAKRAILKRSDAEFLTHLGVHGESMQRELDAFLEKVSAGEAEALLRRIAGHDPSRSDPDPEGGVGEPSAARKDPAV